MAEVAKKRHWDMKSPVSKSTDYQLLNLAQLLVPWLKSASTNLHVLFAADLAGKPLAWRIPGFWNKKYGGTQISRQFLFLAPRPWINERLGELSSRRKTQPIKSKRKKNHFPISIMGGDLFQQWQRGKTGKLPAQNQRKLPTTPLHGNPSFPPPAFPLPYWQRIHH